MTHYVLLKFAEGTDVKAFYEKISRTYDQMAVDLPYLSDPHVRMNTVDRSFNADILIRIELTEEKYLGEYLQHPLHLMLGEEMNPKVIQRVSFDC